MRVLSVCLLLACAFAVTIPDKHQINSFSSKSVLRRVDSTQYGELLLDVIALQLETTDAVGDILGVLDEILADLSSKQSSADEENEDNVEYCNNKGDEYNEIIYQAELDISVANSLIQEFEAEKLRLENEIDRVEAAMEKNRNDKESAINQRAADNATYLGRLAEHEESIDACVEAIELLEQLSNTSSPSLIQVRKTSTTLMNLREKIQKMSSITSTYTPFLKVLLEIAASQENFSNQDTVNQVNQLLSDLKSDLEHSKIDLVDEEDKAQIAHDEYIIQLDGIYASLELELNELYLNLSAAIENLRIQRNIVDEATTLLNNTRASLDALIILCKEQADRYARETEERNEEVEVVDEVKQIFVGMEGEMKDYMKERV